MRIHSPAACIPPCIHTHTAKMKRTARLPAHWSNRQLKNNDDIWGEGRCYGWNAVLPQGWCWLGHCPVFLSLSLSLSRPADISIFLPRVLSNQPANAPPDWPRRRPTRPAVGPASPRSIAGQSMRSGPATWCVAVVWRQPGWRVVCLYISSSGDLNARPPPSPYIHSHFLTCERG